MKAVNANQKDQPTDMNDQQHKQPCRKSNQLTVEGKDSLSAMSLKKAVRSINSFDIGEPLRNANPGRLRDKESRLIHVRPSQENEFIIENEHDELIQTRRKRVDKFVSKWSRRPQPQLPEGRPEQKWVKDRVDRSANIYQRNRYQTEREMGSWIPEYDSDEQQDQNCLNQHFTEYQLQENQYDAIGKDLWKQLKRVPIPIFDGNKQDYNNRKAAFMSCIDQAPATAGY